jgi:inhibitor of cysteine peptidase
MKINLLISVLLMLFLTACVQYPLPIQEEGLETFSSCENLKDQLQKAQEEMQDQGRFYGDMVFETMTTGTPKAMAMDSNEGGSDFSTTNIQVQGVDEADIVKTDGEYIYMISNNNLIIAKAYPGEKAEILSQTELEITPQELFLHNNKILIFGHSYFEYPTAKRPAQMIYPPRSFSTTTVKIFDISNKQEPELERSIDFEGSYLSSRKIDSQVYFVIRNPVQVYDFNEVEPADIIPRIKDSKSSEEFTPASKCMDVDYFIPIYPRNFITVASLDIQNSQESLKTKVILGSGENVYASLNNLYIAETNYNYGPVLEEETPVSNDIPSNTQNTIIHKFSLNNGNTEYQGKGEAPGRILNQFSMDEYKDHFRIATTSESRSGKREFITNNNIYIFNKDLKLVGSLEDLAPGESIFSARFMGEKGYLVTFKKVDPLFVIDLSNPQNPKVLGKLKIPGFSDYLHPYDENHIIGIGKDTVEAEVEWGDFAWYQGLKLAIFDVTDVENPKQMHVEIIGDRGTDSDALHNHKAFLFDRQKELLIIPVRLAEIKDKENMPQNSYGDFTFQGAYVYNLNLEDGFKLKGRITHYEDDEIFKKSGYYFYGDDYNVQRALYIEDILYTISNGKIKLNTLNNLEDLKELDIDLPKKDEYYPRPEPFLI